MSDTSPSKASIYFRFCRKLVSRAIAWHCRAILRITLAVGVLLLAVWATLQFWLFPNLDQYRPDLVRLATREIGLPMTIGNLSGYWDGLSPRIVFRDVHLFDTGGRPAVAFDQVSATVSWWSPVLFKLRFASLTLERPALVVRRSQEGVISLAGIPLNGDGPDSGFGDWVLEQSAIDIRQAQLTWLDDQFQAPPLTVDQVDFRLDNRFGYHRFTLLGRPPAQLASQLMLQGNLRGKRLTELGGWSGQTRFSLDYADLAAWRQWIHYPVSLERGKGGVSGQLTLDRGKPKRLQMALKLNDVQVRLGPQLSTLSVQRMNTEFNLERTGQRYDLQIAQFDLDRRQGADIRQRNLQVELTDTGAGGWQLTQLNAPALDLAPLAELASTLPLPERVNRALQQSNPKGRLRDVRFEWAAAPAQSYRFSGAFEQVSLAPIDGSPGVTSLTGAIMASEQGGTMTLDSQEASLTLPGVFERPLALTKLDAALDWKRDGKTWRAQFRRMRVVNPDLNLRVSGEYRYTGKGAGWADLQAELGSVNASAVWRYMPLVTSADFRHWLQAALKAGTAENARMVLRGELDQFPFERPNSGEFRVDVDARDIDLMFGPGWPRIDKLNAKLAFVGDRLRIDGKSGNIFGTRILKVQGDIPSLNRGDKLLINGEVEGRTDDFLRFVDSSPVDQALDGFTRGIKAQGNARLGIKLDIPLQHTDDTKVAGLVRLASNRLDFGKSIPLLNNVTGTLQFTERGIAFNNLAGEALGGRYVANADTLADGTVRITGRGRVTGAGLQGWLDRPLYRQLKGDTAFQLGLLIRHNGTDLLVESNLQGMAADLPPPFAKAASEQRPLRLQLADSAGQTRWQLRLDRQLMLDMLERPDQPMAGNVVLNPLPEQAGLGGEPIPMAGTIRSGVNVSGTLSAFDVDRWLPLLSSGDGSSTLASLSINDVRANSMTILDKTLRDVKLSAQHEGSSWLFNVSSHELQGVISWNSHESGRVTARLKRLQLPLANAERSPDAVSMTQGNNLPWLDIAIDNVLYKEKNIGKLELRAQPRNDTLRFERLVLQAPDGTLKADGLWAFRIRPESSQFNFRIESDDVGKYLARFGYADTIRKGNAKLEGKLSWQGSPYDPVLATLTGQMMLEAKNGQFEKIDPGIGRLLGILSLQSLPRRMTLDFGDVFSEGLAFDTVTGRVLVNKGVMNTDNGVIVGPAAVITMKGDVDVVKETQNLSVRVVPKVGDGISIAAWAALANPLAGVGALVLQKLMQEPIGQLIAYEYRISGDWREPKVEKGIPAKPKREPQSGK
ncbi:YhdP family protein [Chitinivorax sp. B]|uniref:YhdP family protein n=1 Tax=Chitinivorax sp. B TaxID=2502235 RepID=UPI0010F49061|nr:YhdP family protein [Chitinivorax sp. B]